MLPLTPDWSGSLSWFERHEAYAAHEVPLSHRLYNCCTETGLCLERPIHVNNWKYSILNVSWQQVQYKVQWFLPWLQYTSQQLDFFFFFFLRTLVTLIFQRTSDWLLTNSLELLFSIIYFSVTSLECWYPSRTLTPSDLVPVTFPEREKKKPKTLPDWKLRSCL